MVSQVRSKEEFQSYISAGPVIVDFYADWCGPCKAIAPQVDVLASKYPNVKFIKVNTDALKEVSQQFQIASIPTFIAFNKNTVVGRVSGANLPAIEQLVNKLLDSNQTSTVPTRAPQGYISLKSHIIKNQAEGLNTVAGCVSLLLQGKDVITSDTDEQMILSIPFNCITKLHSLEISVKDVQKAPQSLKFYINQTLIFSDIDSTTAVQEVQLSKEDYKQDGSLYRSIIELKYVLFQRVPKLNVIHSNLDFCRDQHWWWRSYRN
eukprot:NODE_698_length_5079_cov_0.796586.p3 type:complete len:263 gc:universal NODE_698_length_5079_cov_0.796586:3723-2935(-)